MTTNAKKITEDGTGVRVLTRRETFEIKEAVRNYKLRDWKPKFNRYVPRPRNDA